MSHQVGVVSRQDGGRDTSFAMAAMMCAPMAECKLQIKIHSEFTSLYNASCIWPDLNAGDPDVFISDEAVAAERYQLDVCIYMYVYTVYICVYNDRSGHTWERGGFPVYRAIHLTDTHI